MKDFSIFIVAKVSISVLVWRVFWFYNNNHIEAIKLVKKEFSCWAHINFTLTFFRTNCSTPQKLKTTCTYCLVLKELCKLVTNAVSVRLPPPWIRSIMNLCNYATHQLFRTEGSILQSNNTMFKYPALHILGSSVVQLPTK